MRTENWSQQIETFLGRKTRLDMLDELKSRIYSKIKEPETEIHVSGWVGRYFKHKFCPALFIIVYRNDQ